MAGKLCFKIHFFLAKVSQEKKKEEVCVQYILSNKDYNIKKAKHKNFFQRGYVKRTMNVIVKLTFKYEKKDNKAFVYDYLEGNSINPP